MRAALLVLALLLAPAALAAPAPHASPPAQGLPLPPLLLRSDPDGGATLLLAVEDDGAGDYAYRVAAHPGGEVQEVGTYLHPWTWQGVPEVTVGAYAISVSHGLLRAPVVVLENAADESALLQAAQDAVLVDGLTMANCLLSFAQELALPDLGDPVAGSMGFPNFQQHPTVVAWHAHRALPGSEAWLGTYLARDGEVHDVPGGQAGVRSTEVGTMLRLDGQDQRLAGVYVEQVASATGEAGASQAASDVTVGARSPAGRVPLATVQGRDARVGANLSAPDAQTTTLTVGLDAPGGFVPVAGARLDASERVTARGLDIVRLTSVGAFVQGAWLPLAGTRYHSDRHLMTDLPEALVAGGLLGSNQTGDAELSVGTFVLGAYQPLAQAELADHFEGAQFGHATRVTLAALSPLGREPLASVTYDGTDSLADWALRLLQDQATGRAWMVSTGPWAGRQYLPVLGVRYQGDVPGSAQPTQLEFAAGTFLLDYSHFVPLVALGVASDRPIMEDVSRLATDGLGQPGAWQVGVGSYPLGDVYVPLLDVRYVPVQDAEAAAASDVVVDAAGVPVLGVQYRGDATLVRSLGNPLQLGDDGAWSLAVGAYAPGFTPLLRVRHDARGTTVVAGPDLPGL